MADSNNYQFNPELDLMFERIIDVPRESVWTAWTTPEQLKQWFCPLPWLTVDCEINLRPGGIFSTVMKSPEGEQHPGTGCYLEVIPNERLVWTNALEAGFRPAKPVAAKTEKSCDNFAFTAVISLAPHVNGTKYSAHVMHATTEARMQHEALGFQEGWGKALDQLVAMIGNATCDK